MQSLIIMASGTFLDIFWNIFVKSVHQASLMLRNYTTSFTKNFLCHHGLIQMLTNANRSVLFSFFFFTLGIFYLFFGSKTGSAK